MVLGTYVLLLLLLIMTWLCEENRISPGWSTLWPFLGLSPCGTLRSSNNSFHSININALANQSRSQPHLLHPVTRSWLGNFTRGSVVRCKPFRSSFPLSGDEILYSSGTWWILEVNLNGSEFEYIGIFFFSMWDAMRLDGWLDEITKAIATFATEGTGWIFRTWQLKNR